MNCSINKLSIPILILFILPLFYGCPGSKPEITLTVTDCEVDKITITENTRITTQSGNQWSLSTVITVKCDGQVIENAELNVEFWWPNGSYKLKTNAQGEIRKTKRGHGSKPTGEKFKVKIKGNDGDKVKEFTIQ